MKYCPCVQIVSIITDLRLFGCSKLHCQFYSRGLSMYNAQKIVYPRKKIILFIVCFERENYPHGNEFEQHEKYLKKKKHEL